jgi:ABC-type dipeptide/oligopeptide/nickel transport system permease component
MLSAAAVGRRSTLVAGLALRVVAQVLLAAALIAFLTHALTSRLNADELRLNTLLMGTRPFRVQSDVEAFLSAVGSSLLLLGVALAAAVSVGVAVGIAHASVRSRPVRAATWACATLAATLPAFLWAIVAELAVLAIAAQTGHRLLPIAGFGVDEHIVLPAFALAARPAGYLARLTARVIEDARQQEYVRAALAKGLSDAVVLRRHILPNIAPTIVAATILGARGALSSLPVVEFIFVWGGAGLTFIQAIGARQPTLAAGLAVTFALASAVLAIGGEIAQRRVRALG